MNLTLLSATLGGSLLVIFSVRRASRTSNSSILGDLTSLTPVSMARSWILCVGSPDLSSSFRNIDLVLSVSILGGTLDRRNGDDQTMYQIPERSYLNFSTTDSNRAPVISQADLKAVQIEESRRKRRSSLDALKNFPGLTESLL